MKFLVTGAAGFIGHYVAEGLCMQGHCVVGLDNLNDYYEPQLKLDRLERLKKFENFRFIRMDISNRDGISDLFISEKFQRVIHLAAQAGVRYSLENPMAYVDSNLVGFMTVLEGCRHTNVEHLVYASSSSVYGMSEKIPFSEGDRVDNPVSLYAATKKSNELLAHSYSHLYGLPTTGLRFSTVYGPWGRPDMAPYLFVDAIANDRPIKVFNKGEMWRDFSFIDDVVEDVVRAQDLIPCVYKTGDEEPMSKAIRAPFSLFNIGNSSPVELEDFIFYIEAALGKKARKKYLPIQDGDVTKTYADTSLLNRAVSYRPGFELKKGIAEFVDWYLHYKELKNYNSSIKEEGALHSLDKDPVGI